MKKTNHSFTIEYKNARRKAERKPNSIWGDLDLRSVAGQANEETFSLSAKHDEAIAVNHPTGSGSVTVPMLTPATPQQNIGLVTEEMPMPDENETVTEMNTPTSAEAVPTEPLKQRKPRTKKLITMESDPSQVTGSASDGTHATVGKPRRGRKAKTIPVAGRTKSKPVDRASKTMDAAPAISVDIVDDMAELLRLEEENRSLRQQLSEKLRAENADLRKRLNLA